jgi:hypothetical protein
MCHRIRWDTNFTSASLSFRPKKGSPISAARGAYEILKQMPERDGELQYRTKSRSEEHERVVFESELGAF